MVQPAATAATASAQKQRALNHAQRRQTAPTAEAIVRKAREFMPPDVVALWAGMEHAARTTGLQGEELAAVPVPAIRDAHARAIDWMLLAGVDAALARDLRGARAANALSAEDVCGLCLRFIEQKRARGEPVHTAPFTPAVLVNGTVVMTGKIDNVRYYRDVLLREVPVSAVHWTPAGCDFEYFVRSRALPVYVAWLITGHVDIDEVDRDAVETAEHDMRHAVSAAKAEGVHGLGAKRANQRLLAIAARVDLLHHVVKAVEALPEAERAGCWFVLFIILHEENAPLAVTPLQTRLAALDIDELVASVRRGRFGDVEPCMRDRIALRRTVNTLREVLRGAPAGGH